MALRAHDEGRLLNADEQALVEASRPPAVDQLSKAELQALQRRLRNARDRAHRAGSQQKREMRGKADPRGVAPAADNTGTVAKKAVLVEALTRIGAALRKFAPPRKPSATEVLRKALEAKQANAPQHPSPGRAAGKGMQPRESGKPSVRMDPREIGRVSQATKVAQAKRDR